MRGQVYGSVCVYRSVWRKTCQNMAEVVVVRVLLLLLTGLIALLLLWLFPYPYPAYTTCVPFFVMCLVSPHLWLSPTTLLSEASPVAGLFLIAQASMCERNTTRHSPQIWSIHLVILLAFGRQIHVLSQVARRTHCVSIRRSTSEPRTCQEGLSATVLTSVHSPS